MKSNIKKGFTLVEIMIVISIIGILSVVLIPKVGAIKIEAKNNSVRTNVSLVRSYLENRAGKDGAAYYKAMSGISKPTQEQIISALSSISENIKDDMTNRFSSGNPLINPFNNIDTINYSQGDVSSNNPSSASVVLGYSLEEPLPDKNSIIANSPSGTDFIGDTVVIIYSTGYVLYGVDDSGEIISNSVYIIKFPPIPAEISAIIDRGGDNPDDGDEPGDDGNNNGGDNGDDNGNTGNNTTADLFQANTLNVLGDSNTEMNLGNSGSTDMNITGSVYLQGKKIVLQQRDTNISGNLSILGVGDSDFTIGNGENTLLNVNGITNLQGNTITINNNLNAYNNVSIYGNTINFSTSNINTNFNSGICRIQSSGSTYLGSNINIKNSIFSIVSNNIVDFKNAGKSLVLDSNNSSAYIKGNQINFYYALNASSPITMIADDILDFGNNGQGINTNSPVYLRGSNKVSINKNAKFGDSYIESNSFNYQNATINTNKLDTCIVNFQGGTLNPMYMKVPSRQPHIPEAIAPASITPITTFNQIKSIRSGAPHNSVYNVTQYNGLAFRIIKGSDNSALKQALFPNGENIDSNIYKLLIIDGDCTIDGSVNNWGDKNLVFNNYIIYCTGKLSFSTSIDSISFYNSAVISKDYDLQVKCNMTQLDSTKYTESVKNQVNACIEKYLQ